MTNKREENIFFKTNMSGSSKRWIFGILFFSFLIYTISVYTCGTSDDKGQDYITPNSIQGKFLFQKYNCTSCHQLYGLGGYMGPDLTNVISTENKGPAYVKAFLKSGTQRMPDFKLSEVEMEQLIEYLTYVDKTGISPVKKFEVRYDGTITQK